MASPTMLEPFEYRGMWWLPKVRKTVPGSLRFEPGGDIELKLHGPLEDTRAISYERQDIILGREDGSGTEITATGCWGWVSPTSSDYTASMLLVGQHFSELDDIKLEWMSVRYHNVEECVGITGISETLEKGDQGLKTLRIEYTPPEHVIAKLGEFTVKAEFRASVDRTPFGRELRQRTFLRAETASERHITDFLDGPFQCIHYLVEFVAGNRLPVLEIQCGNKRDPLPVNKDSIEYSPIAVVASGQPSPLPLPRLKEVDRLSFALSSLDDRFEIAIQSWQKACDLFAPTFDGYFTVLRHPSIPVVLRFLSLVHALESYNRRTGTNVEQPREEHKHWLSTVLEAVPEEYRTRLKGKLAHSNEPTLRQRMKELLNDVPVAVSNFIGDERTFIDGVVATRHYHTHYDASQGSKALKDEQLRICINKLMILLRNVLLGFLQLSKSEIELILKRDLRKFGVF